MLKRHPRTSQHLAPTCGGVGVVIKHLTPDMSSSVISGPPWLGSRMQTCQEIQLWPTLSEDLADLKILTSLLLPTHLQ